MTADQPEAPEAGRLGANRRRPSTPRGGEPGDSGSATDLPGGRGERTDLRDWRTGEGRLLGVSIPQPRGGHLSAAVPPGVTERVDQAAPMSDRIWTLPNVISMVRIALIPVFVALILVWDAPGKALAMLAVLGVTDWIDGKIARMWNMRSRLGAKLDPVADRILIAAVPIVFAIAGYVPWWVVWVLLARDLLLAATYPLYRRKQLMPEVIYLGKAASFALMWSFPLLLAAEAGIPAAYWLRIVGEATLWWGVGLYLWSGLVYLARAVQVARLP